MLAVITGASSGIGAAFARKLAARGFDVLLVARREERLRSIAREIAGQHRVRAEVLAADLTDSAQLASVAQAIEAAPGLGLLVNNAGFGTQGYFWETDPASQTRMHALHVVATARLTHAALRNLVPRAAPGTGVINVSSVAAFGVSPQNVSYCATKTWMNAFTAGLELELAGRGSPVRVQALCPGFTLSEFHDVLGMERSTIPSPLWMTADFVVTESLRAFDRGKALAIPGWRYKLLAAFMRITPGVIMRRLSAAYVRRYRRRKAATTSPPDTR